MEDYKILLAVFGLVIYFIYTTMRRYFNPEEQAPPRDYKPLPKYKPQPTPASEADASPSAPAAPPPPSLEEMMRRLGQPMERTAEKARDVMEEARERADEARGKIKDQARAKSEEAKDRVKQRVTDFIRTTPRPVVNYDDLSERRRERETPSPQLSSFRQPQQELVNPYAVLLRNPADVRTAFILTQILERKHF